MGEVDRRPLLLPDGATAAAFFPRPLLATERAAVTATAGVGLDCNILPSSSCNRSMRAWISAAFLRVEEDSFTGASYT